MKQILFRIGKYLILKTLNSGVEHIDFKNGLIIIHDTERYIRDYKNPQVNFKINELSVMSVECFHESELINTTVPYYQCKKCFKRLGEYYNSNQVTKHS